MYKQKIGKILLKATNLEEVRIDFPRLDEFGDYTTNVAWQYSKIHLMTPQAAGEEIKSKFKSDFIEKIDVAKDGFINFWLKKEVLVGNLTQIDREKENYGKSDSVGEKLAIVEYSSANIAKPFTIGHLRSTIIGDAISNILEFVGWKILRDNHLGDWGTQFGKQIYAIKTWGKKGGEYTVKELVGLYVKFHEESEKDSSLEDKAREWFKKLEDGDLEAREIWKKCVEWSWEEFDRIYKILGIRFSQEFENGRGLGESFFETRMAPVIDELKDKGLLKEGEDGAHLVFFDHDKYPPAMILKKDGATLYHTRDLATDKYRLEKYNPDLILNEVGSEQNLYFQQLFEMEKLLGWFKDGQRVHVGHGLVRFKGGKMSTRKGNVIWMEDILDETIKKAKELGSKDGETAKKVAVGALKYNDLKRDPKTEIIFDWDEILNMEGNSGPYLQYTVARTNSVLAKAKNDNLLEIGNWKLEIEEELTLRLLVRFSEVIENAAKTYSPNLLCNYLYDLAQKYNGFYNKHKIIGSENEEFRVNLTKGVNQVLKTGLSLLGIQAPEKM